MEMSEELQAALNAMEQRALKMNTKLLGLRAALQVGNFDRALSIWALIQESNWTQRKALVEAGAIDSLKVNRGSSSTVWDDDVPPIDVEKLDLADLRSEFNGEDKEQP